MDIIQATVLALRKLVLRFKSIAGLLTYGTSTGSNDDNGFSGFWIFNW